MRNLSYKLRTKIIFIFSHKYFLDFLYQARPNDNFPTHIPTYRVIRRPLSPVTVSECSKFASQKSHAHRKAMNFSYSKSQLLLFWHYYDWFSSLYFFRHFNFWTSKIPFSQFKPCERKISCPLLSSYPINCDWQKWLHPILSGRFDGE